MQESYNDTIRKHSFKEAVFHSHIVIAIQAMNVLREMLDHVWQTFIVQKGEMGNPTKPELVLAGLYGLLLLVVIFLLRNSLGWGLAFIANVFSWARWFVFL